MSKTTVHFEYVRTTRKSSPRTLIRTSDGDTPVIEQPIRMVSCDTPEKAGYAGGPQKSQPKLNKCRERLESGFYDELPDVLIDYLVAKLADDAAEKQIAAGNKASQAFDQLLNKRLIKEDGSIRKVAVIPTGEIIDRYSRMLAYLAPWYSNGKSDPLPPKDDVRRKTFNLDMIENGWAALFLVYPSLPQNNDLNKAIRAASKAWKQKRGAWKEFGKDFLLAYEYRMCIKLGTAKSSRAGMKEAFKRVCVDLRNRKLEGKFGFCKIPPCYRLWIWEEDLEQARTDLELVE